MYSLKDIVYQKIYSASIQRNEVLIFNGRKLPQELYEDYAKALQRRLVELKKESMELNEFPQSARIKLNLVEDAHKYGLCQDLFEGKCHLCNERCIICFPEHHQCIECYTFTLEKRLEVLKKRKDNPVIELHGLQIQIDSHDQKICLCRPQIHTSRFFI